MDEADCLIVGGGPAGLIAATYLARFRRRVVVVSAGEPRAAWIPLSHNLPGFADGIPGHEIMARLTAQATRYGVEIREGWVDALAPTGDGRLVARGERLALAGRRVILATGIVDRVPDLPGFATAVGRGAIRLCPVCDGYEAIDRATAVIGPPERAIGEAGYLKTYTDRVTALRLAGHEPADERQRARAAALGVALFDPPVADLRLAGGGPEAELEDGTRLQFDTAYPAMGVSPRSDLLAALGGDCSASGCITTDSHQRTTVPGVWACGDVVDALNQIAVAAGHAAIAATDVHNDLRAADARGQARD